MTVNVAKVTHPQMLRVRLLRALRVFRRVAGWGRLIKLVMPDSAEGKFTVRSKHGWFTGNLASYIDRQVYVMGWYERDLIDVFLNSVPAKRRRTILDVGANVGTHSIAFGQVFDRVHAFEPNSDLWDAYEKNVQLNDPGKISLHKFGLSDQSETLPLFMTETLNYGLGTVCMSEQYDVPLKEHGSADLCCGDEVVDRLNLGPIDAIKVDVQGFEPQVLRGLHRTLRNTKPLVWLEISSGTQEQLRVLRDLTMLFPFPTNVNRFVVKRIGPCRIVSLEQIDDLTAELQEGDYLIFPKDS